MARIYPKGSPTTPTIDKIIQSMIDDGTMSKLADKYLAAVWGKDPAKVPVLQSVSRIATVRRRPQRRQSGALALGAPIVPRRADALCARGPAVRRPSACCCAWAATRHRPRGARSICDRRMAPAGSSSSALMIAGAAVLFWPAIRAMAFAQRAGAGARRQATSSKRASIAAAARDWAYLTFGWGAVALVALGFVALRAWPTTSPSGRPSSSCR